METPPTPAPAPADGNLPPAAVIVSQSPRELELETQLRQSEEARLAAERAAADAEDRAQQLIEIDRRRPAPAAKKKIKVPGNTFFHDEEEIEVEEEN